MDKLNAFSNLTTGIIPKIAKDYGTPVYIYDESLLIEKCKDVLSMPNAFGLTVRYAMKANSNRTLLKIISSQGIHIDASSFNEVKRAGMAGIPYKNMMLTSQEVLSESDRTEMESLVLQGLTYNICSLRQMELFAGFAAENKVELSIRICPGVGSGESSTRNTGDKYSCFGVYLSDIPQAVNLANKYGLKFRMVHVHIGSGGEPEKWRENIDRELGLIETYFPDAEAVNFGGGLREARMPEETKADIVVLGQYAKLQVEEFYKKTGRKLKMEIEPGTYLVANAGYILTRIMDMKRTGESGLDFIILDGGLDVNARPLLYGAEHPFYLVSKTGCLLYSPFFPELCQFEAVVVGCCCESGDSLCLDQGENNIPRKMKKPEIDDFVLIGGSGAYCSSMTPFNYNSHMQIPELLYDKNGQIKLIRRRQTMEQMLENEI